MAAGMLRFRGPATTWRTRAPSASGPSAEISLTWVRQRGSLAGVVKNANTSSGGRSTTMVLLALGMQATVAPVMLSTRSQGRSTSDDGAGRFLREAGAPALPRGRGAA